jgi:hypothetical protein
MLQNHAHAGLHAMEVCFCIRVKPEFEHKGNWKDGYIEFFLISRPPQGPREPINYPYPPSTVSVIPVIKLASSDAKNNIAFPISSGLANLFK